MKKITTLLLVLCILFSVSGCGGAQVPSENTNMNQQNNQYNATENNQQKPS